MTPTRDSVYATQYEARQRDPIIDRMNRASVANGRMSRWQRFNRNVELVAVCDNEGNARYLTPKQAEIASLANGMVDGEMLTMREMAKRLNVAPSTVSRALAKLMAWGILVYMVGRGRFAGLVIVKYVKDGGFLDYKRKQAKERVRRWREAAQRRISRLTVNVASYFIDGGRGITEGVYRGSSTKGATLTLQRSWTAEEIEESLA